VAKTLDAKDFDRTLLGFGKAHDVANGRAFAGAIGAKITKAFAFMNMDGDIENPTAMTIVFRQMFNVDDSFFFHGFTLSSVRFRQC